MKRLSLMLACLYISACSINAPMYQPLAGNSNLLQDSTASKVKVTEFSLVDPELNSISMRGSSLLSPYNKSFSLYITKALEEELKLAGLWAEKSNIEITGALLAHDVDLSGFSVGTSSATAKFIVKRDDKVTYDKTLSETHEFESSFIGAIAIPAGQKSYQSVIQKLFSKLFSDNSFIQSIK